MGGAVILLVLLLTGSLGNNIQDPDVVFIGPGSGSQGLSEVLLLPSLTPGTCTPPPFPHGDYFGYVGRLTPAGPLLCGGYQIGVSLLPVSSCYLLGRDGSWVTSSSQMTVERVYAAAVELGDSWWVTGGQDANITSLTSTEVLTGNTWLSSTPLPINGLYGLYGHCMVKIDSSHVFIAGGWPQSVAFLYSSTSDTFSPLPVMAMARHQPACGILGSDVWVGGGWPPIADKSVEIFSLTTQTWRDGPPLPIGTKAGRMMTVDGSLLMFGNRVIWQLKTSGGQVYWDQVGEMETGRRFFAILKMKLSDCTAWNKD